MTRVAADMAFSNYQFGVPDPSTPVAGFRGVTDLSPLTIEPQIWN